jgi:putative transposase
LVFKVIERYDVSGRRACRIVQLCRASFWYKSQAEDPAALRAHLKELAFSRPRYGYRRLHVLLGREGWKINHKRVYRLYRQEGLQVRTKRRRKFTSRARVPPGVALQRNDQWSVDFVSDALVDGRKFRGFTVVDNCTREGLAVEVRHSFPSSAVTQVLDSLMAKHGRPRMIIMDNGTEFTSNEFDAWAYAQQITLHYITPGRPMENGYIESFNGKLRDECLSANWFNTLADAQKTIEAWRRDYNETRPHSSLGYLAPAAYVASLLTEGSLATKIN